MILITLKTDCNMEKELFYIGSIPYKRFLLISYHRSAPSGGLEDILYQFDDINEALEAFDNEQNDRKQLFDRVKGLEIDVTSYGLKY